MEGETEVEKEQFHIERIDWCVAATAASTAAAAAAAAAVACFIPV